MEGEPKEAESRALPLLKEARRRLGWLFVLSILSQILPAVPQLLGGGLPKTYLVVQVSMYCAVRRQENLRKVRSSWHSHRHWRSSQDSETISGGDGRIKSIATEDTRRFCSHWDASPRLQAPSKRASGAIMAFTTKWIMLLDLANVQIRCA